MIDEEKKNFNLVAKKEEGVILEKKLAMKLNMMNQLESQGKTELLDGKGVNRFKQAQEMY